MGGIRLDVGGTVADPAVDSHPARDVGGEFDHDTAAGGGEEPTRGRCRGTTHGDEVFGGQLGEFGLEGARGYRELRPRGEIVGHRVEDVEHVTDLAEERSGLGDVVVGRGVHPLTPSIAGPRPVPP